MRAKTSTRNMSESARLSSEPPLVLIADDNDIERILMRESLEGAGFAVEEAGDGAAAVAAAQRHLPDLALLDVLMPEMDGFAACLELRKWAATRHIPVVMVTGADDIQSIERAYEVGATDFISKPIDLTVLPYRLRWILKAAQSMSKVSESERRLRRAQEVAQMGSLELQVEDGTLDADLGDPQTPSPAAAGASPRA